MYIRTKNKIYRIENNIYNQTFAVDKNNKWQPLEYIEKDIIKQSENLEELCDCFVIEWLPTNHKDIFTIDKYSKEVVKSCIGNSKTNIYGAIWTSKGLIYVAKMDSEGKLVLI